MNARFRSVSLGLFAGALLAVPPAGAQGRIARPVPKPQIAVTLPAPSPRGSNHDKRPRLDRHFPTRRHGWSLPLLVTSGYDTPASVPQPVTYPVPYYYPVPVPTPAAAPVEKPVERPYDPTKSRTLVVGAGADGGGGVMQIERTSADSIRLTWRGTNRPIREATLFLARGDHKPLVSRLVDTDHREAMFTIRGLTHPLAFAGLTIVFADGSTRTSLVPLLGRTPPPAR
jgi:hypothetical protein